MRKGISFGLLARRGVWFYRRTQLSVLAGVVVAAAILVGALLVGDCVRYSLQRFAVLRLGQTEYAIDARNRLFDESLADRLREETAAPVSALLRLKGIAIREGDAGAAAVQVNQVNVLGIDASFGQFGWPAGLRLSEVEIALSRKLAAALGAAPGDEVVIRVGQPAQMPRDAPLSSRRERLSRRGVFTVRAVVSDEALGRFSLDANQVAPYNAFVSRAWLQARVSLPGKANLLLVGPGPEEALGAGELQQALARAWRPRQVGLFLRPFPEHGFTQLESDRIFLDPVVTEAGLRVGAAAGRAPVGVLVYLVNGIERADGSQGTPYSFVLACGTSADRRLSRVPVGMKDTEIIVNRWVADRLAVGPGDTVRLRYWELTASGGFTERAREFSVHAVLEMSDMAAERAAIPRFPGLTDVETCGEWDIGLPMDEALLDDAANEEYWNAYRETPKAIVTLAAGQAMWSNRFGSLSAVRYPLREGQAAEEILAGIRRQLNPGDLGLFFVPVRERAAAAIAESLDFGQLFLSMSFFLIVAALMLTALLFAFGVEQRMQELGALRAVGYRVREVRRLLLLEGSVVALAGSVAGGLLGMLYTRALVAGLATYWRDAVAGAAIRYHARPASVLAGMVVSFVCAMGAVVIALWRQTRRSPGALLSGDPGVDTVTGPRRQRLTVLLSGAGVLLAVGIVALVRFGGPENMVPGFFGAGALLLVAGLGFCRTWIVSLDQGARQRITIGRLGIRNAARRPGRSLTIVSLLASGGFIVFAVSCMQENVRAHARERWSGTGGFALFAEATLPVPDAPGTAQGRARFKLDREAALAGVQAASIRVHDGDDASCFNLNRAQAPRLLGVDPGSFAERDAFVPEGRGGDFWGLLHLTLPGGEIPGLVGDSDTAMWGLKKKVGSRQGDVLTYRDERGELFKVKLVGKLPMRLSVFQGTVLISAGAFASCYPSEGGYRMFLFDLPPGRSVAPAQQALAQRMAGVGLNVVPAVDRLLEFYSVESTYLSVFLVLGGLGLLLGSLGVGLVVLRNVLERRSEFAILRCVGFARGRVRRVVMAEHWFLLLAGLVIGLVASVVAIWPNLVAPGVEVPLAALGGLLAAVVLTGIAWIYVAARLALRGRLLDSLRNE